MNLQEIEQKVKAKCISNNIFQVSPNVADFFSFLNNYSASQRYRVIVKKRKENDSQVSSFSNIAKIMAV